MLVGATDAGAELGRDLLARHALGEEAQRVHLARSDRFAFSGGDFLVTLRSFLLRSSLRIPSWDRLRADPAWSRIVAFIRLKE